MTGRRDQLDPDVTEPLDIGVPHGGKLPAARAAGAPAQPELTQVWTGGSGLVAGPLISAPSYS